jgi:glycosyltransferase involved in cell wall biosynthesis
MTPSPKIVHILPDKMGGLLNIVANLLAYRHPDGFEHCAVLVHNPFAGDTRFGDRLAADRQIAFEHGLPNENLYSVVRRLAKTVAPGPGIVVSHDWIELAMVCRYDPGKAVVQVLHGDHDYYYDLAEKHEAVIDAFVCYSRAMYENLLRRLPGRAGSVFHLPYGIPIPERGRSPRPDGSAPLRLIYSGRLEQGQKGVFDLPEIDRLLAARGVAVEWTVMGDGPDGAELRRRWTGPSAVRWLGPKTNAEVLEELPRHDVFVLPTRAEGFPVALLEAMAAGLVPVVSDIPSGVREAIEAGVTGFLPPVGDCAAFADAIAALAADRARLEEVSAAARRRVAERYEVRARTADYQALFARLFENHSKSPRPRPARVALHYGSRLDQPWLPNPLVRAIRTPRRWLRLKRLQGLR